MSSDWMEDALHHKYDPLPENMPLYDVLGLTGLLTKHISNEEVL